MALKLRRLSSLIIFISLTFSSCINNESEELKVNIVRFDQSLISASSNADKGCSWLTEKFPGIYDVFALNLTKIGDCKTNPEGLNKFTSNEFISSLYSASDSIYKEMDWADSDFSRAFHRIGENFRDYPIPTVYTVISGSRFPGALLNDSTLLIGLDLYLGANSKFYEGFEDYTKRRYIKEHIVPNSIAVIAEDIMFLSGIEEPANGTILENIIYHGKRIALMETFLPETEDSLLIGYSQAEVRWCNSSAGDIWAFMVDRELLYNRENINMQRIVGDGPFTPGMPEDSPGKIGQWVGWQIVSQLIDKKGKELSIKELLKMPAQTVLEESGYRPKR